jgi:histidine triad (HIT) family protein
MTAYDDMNVFARILRGELPCEKVYEDAACLALMDIMPRADGHVLVIPRVRARTILDIDTDALAGLMAGVQTVARAVKAGMAADGHVHVLPRWTGVSLRPHTGEMAKPEALSLHAGRIRAAF